MFQSLTVADFYDTGEYVSTITANGHAIMQDHCNPDLDCIHYYYTCLNGVDVTEFIDLSQNLTISAFATDDVDNCPFKVSSQCTRSVLCSYVHVCL